MGTRHDYYVGRGKNAEWLGSLPMDGYPEGLPKYVLRSKTEEEWRKNVEKMLKEEGDRATFPKDGWPWPWKDSRTTDYAYAWDGGKIWASCFGGEWFNAFKHARKLWRIEKKIRKRREQGEPIDDLEEKRSEIYQSRPDAPKCGEEKAVFPDMSARKNVTLGPRSGLIVLAAR
jgi:hypothetical protein